MGFAAGEAAVERLEGRVLLTAGDVRWSVAADIRADDADSFSDVAVQADGKIVAVGTAYRAPDDDFMIVRYTADGRLDQSFGSGGVRYVNFGSNWVDKAKGVVIQADGKIVVAGDVDTAGDMSVGLVRLNRDGSLDATFGTAGRIVERGSEDYLYMGDGAIAGTPDGGFVLGTGTGYGGDAPLSVGSVHKFNANGGKDAGFNGGGFRVFGEFGYVGDVAVDPRDGKIVALTADVVFRLTTAGGLDGTFSNDGITGVSFDSGTDPFLRAVAVAADGRVVVGGWSSETSSVMGVARLKADGTYDNAFDGNGRFSFDPEGTGTGYLSDIAVLPGGAVVAVGNGIGSQRDGWIAVLTPGGVLDGAFAGDGRAGWEASSDGGLSTVIGGVAVTSEGNYVIVGSATQAVPPFQDQFSGIALFEGRFGRRDDLLGWAGTGDWYAAGSTGSSFGTDAFGRWNRNAGWKTVETADLDGDGDSDVLGRDSTGQWWVGRNTGSAFATAAGAKWNEAAGWRDLRIADFDGDGRADIAARTSTGQWWVSLSTGTGLANGALWARWNKDAGWQDVLAADFDGDGRSDLAGRTSGGQWYVGLSGGSGFALALWDTWSAGGGWVDVMSGDFDGDGRQDIAGRASNGQWWVSRSTGTGFAKSHWGTWSASAGWADVSVGDFDRDGRTDLAGRASNGQWFLAASVGTGFATRFWATWSAGAGWRDVTVGDYDGDGRSDIAGRTSGGEWYVTRRVGGSLATQRWGKWNEAAGWTAFGGELVPTA